MLGAVMVFLQAEASFWLDLNALNLKATSFVNAVVPTPGAMHLPVQRVFFVFHFLQLGDDVFDVLAAGFVCYQHGVGCFHYDQVFAPPPPS